MMISMGWQGGIGAKSQGIADPIGTCEKQQKRRRCPLVGVATSEEHAAEWGPEVVKVYGQERIQLV